MIATTVEIPELFDTLAKASWHDVGSSDDDHKLERTDLPSQLEVLYIRKKDKPNQIYMAKVKNGNDWKCVKCATTVLAARVAHTVAEKSRTKLFPTVPPARKSLTSTEAPSSLIDDTLGEVSPIKGYHVR